jgi:hypothetical protein
MAQWPINVHPSKQIGGLLWDKADEIVKKHATEVELPAWNFSKRYRSGAEMKKHMEGRRHANHDRPARNTDEDIARFLEAGLIRQVSPDEVRSLASSFCCPEAAKLRRRWILHPVELNEASEAELHATLHDSHPHLASLLWPSTGSHMAEAVLASDGAIVLDFVSYFHQMSIDTEAAVYAAIRHDGKFYIPTTVPTGCREAPVFAQLLSVCMAREICARFPGVRIDSWIDNFRILHAGRRETEAAAREFKTLAGELGLATQGTDESFQSSYVYLGWEYNHLARTVAPSQKMRQKLRGVCTKIATADTTWGDVQSAMALTNAAALTLEPTSRFAHYSVFKYFRRRAKRASAVARCDPETPCPVWNSIIPEWVAWVARLADTRRTLAPTPSVPAARLYTDASGVGWGAMFFTVEATHVLAGPWLGSVAREHINILELRALVLATERLNINDINVDVFVDNTSALAWAGGKMPRRKVAAHLLERLSAARERRRWRVSSTQYVASAANPADVWSRMGSFVEKHSSSL